MTTNTIIAEAMNAALSFPSFNMMAAIDMILTMSGTIIMYTSAMAIYIMMMLIFLGHSLVIASVRAAVWTIAACIAVRYDYLVIRAVNAVGGAGSRGISITEAMMNNANNTNDHEWSLTWSMLMLCPFIMMLVPCWRTASLPRPWLFWYERVIIWSPWFVLMIATVMRSWTMMEVAMVMQFGWARYAVNNKQEWIQRACDHSFAPRLLDAPPHVAHSIYTDVVTSTTPLIAPIAHIIGNYLAADDSAPLDLMTDDVIARFATDAWIARTPDDITGLPGSHHCRLTSVGDGPLYMMPSSLPLRLGNHSGSIKVRIPVRYSLRGHPTYTLDFDTNCEHSSAARHAWSELHHMTSWLSLPFDNTNNGALLAAISHARHRAFAAHIADDGHAIPLAGDVPKPSAELASRRLSLVVTIKMATWNVYDHGAIGLQYQFDSVRARNCCRACGNDDILMRDDVADDAAIAAELAAMDQLPSDMDMMANTTDGVICCSSSSPSCSPSSSPSSDIGEMKQMRASLHDRAMRAAFITATASSPSSPSPSSLMSSNDSITTSSDHHTHTMFGDTTRNNHTLHDDDDMIIIDGIHHVIPHVIPSFITA